MISITFLFCFHGSWENKLSSSLAHSIENTPKARCFISPNFRCSFIHLGQLFYSKSSIRSSPHLFSAFGVTSMMIPLPHAQPKPTSIMLLILLRIFEFRIRLGRPVQRWYNNLRMADRDFKGITLLGNIDDFQFVQWSLPGRITGVLVTALMARIPLRFG